MADTHLAYLPLKLRLLGMNDTQWYNQLPELEVGWMDGFGIFAGQMDGSKQGGRTSYPRPTPVIPRVHFDLNLSEKPKTRTICCTNTCNLVIYG